MKTEKDKLSKGWDSVIGLDRKTVAKMMDDPEFVKFMFGIVAPAIHKAYKGDHHEL